MRPCEESTSIISVITFGYWKFVIYFFFFLNLLFFWMNKKFFEFFLHMASSLTIWLSWLLSAVSFSIFYFLFETGGSKVDKVVQVTDKCWMGWNDHIPLIFVASFLLMQPKMPLTVLAARADFWLMLSLLLTGTPWSFSAGWLLSLYCHLQLFLTKYRTSHLAFEPHAILSGSIFQPVEVFWSQFSIICNLGEIAFTPIIQLVLKDIDNCLDLVLMPEEFHRLGLSSWTYKYFLRPSVDADCSNSFSSWIPCQHPFPCGTWRYIADTEE